MCGGSVCVSASASVGGGIHSLGAFVHHPACSGMCILEPYSVGEICLGPRCGCRGLKLDYVINTHHHHDHTGGNIELQNKYGCEVRRCLIPADTLLVSLLPITRRLSASHHRRCAAPGDPLPDRGAQG